jgi:hypothetical protein
VGTWICGNFVESEEAGQALRCSNDPGLDRVSFELKPARIITLAKAETQKAPATEASEDALPVVIDMESHAWAELSVSQGLPFQVLRVISDNPDAPLPDSVGLFASALNADSRREKMTGFARGLANTALAPHEMARFLLQSSRLPKVLETGWKELASL